MDLIHFKEEKIIRGKKVSFVFFNHAQKEMFNPEYIQLIKNTRTIKIDRFIEQNYLLDTHGNKYRLMCSAVIEPTTLNPRMTLDLKSNFYFYNYEDIKKFMINNDFPVDTELTKDFVKTHLLKLDIITKVINEPRIIWTIKNINNYNFSAIAIIDNEVVAIANCEILNDEEMEEYFRDKETMFPKMKLYISNVDVKPGFQGQGLCKPITSFMIKHLKRLGFDMLFIENASNTKGGVPACICYYKAGIENNYNMRYKDHYDDSKPFKKMNMSDCFMPIDKLPTTYYYISDKFNQSGKEKLRRVVHNLGVI